MPEDLAVKKQCLENIVAEYEPQEWPCAYDLSTGLVDCSFDCISFMADVECPEKKVFRAQRELSALNMRSFLKLAFSSPDLAAENDLLKGEDVIMSHR
jgi:hypothetical protein